MVCAGKYAAIDDIKRHVMTVGSKQWAVVRARHPNVSTASFWRYVRFAKRDLAAEDLRVVSEQGGSSNVAISPPDRVEPLAAYRRLFADVGELREHALNSDGTIRSPMMFDRSIKRRASLLAQWVKLGSQIYTVRNVQMFMDALIDELAAESPELQRRVFARVRRLRMQHS